MDDEKEKLPNKQEELLEEDSPVLSSYTTTRRILLLGSVIENANPTSTSSSSTRMGNTLKLFATGTWRDYVENGCRYMNLDNELKRRLKCLTVVSLCEHATCVEYRVIQREIDMDSLDEMESLVIHGCMYTGLISGTLDQKRQCLNVCSAVPREVSPEALDGMVASLSMWLDQAHRVARFLEEQAHTIGKTVEKSAIRASYQEQQLQEASRKVSMEKAKKMAAETEGHLLSLPQKERHGSRQKKTRRQ